MISVSTRIISVGAFLAGGRCIAVGSGIYSGIVQPLTRQYSIHIERYGVVLLIPAVQHLTVCREIVIIICFLPVMPVRRVVCVIIRGIVILPYGLISQLSGQITGKHRLRCGKGIIAPHGDRRDRRSQRMCLLGERIVR